MDKIKLTDIDIYKIGNEIQLSGAIWSGPNKSFLCTFPLEDLENPIHLPMDIDEWKKFLRQSDTQEVEILQHGPHGITKAIIRKSTRQVEDHIRWVVYRRDFFTCRYCFRSDVPLTADHLVLYEDGGPFTEANLVTCCKKCNKKRGNIKYKDWIESDYYKKVSQNLDEDVKRANLHLVGKLNLIEKVAVIKSR